jgi:hypothetical protein
VAAESDLSYAEEWIAEMERVGENLGLDKEMMCSAFCQRATGEVKAYVDRLGISTKRDWSKLCNMLIAGFGKAIRMKEYKRELDMMDKIAGMPLALAVERVQRLMEVTDHPPKDLVPIQDLLCQFPANCQVKVGPAEASWETWQDAIGDLVRMAGSPEAHRAGREWVAEPAPKTSEPATKARIVAVAEPGTEGSACVADPAGSKPPWYKDRRPKRNNDKEPVRCWNCGGWGHKEAQCPSGAKAQWPRRAQAADKDNLPKN